LPALLAVVSRAFEDLRIFEFASKIEAYFLSYKPSLQADTARYRRRTKPCSAALCATR
jgi:hypothetical protein